MFEPTIRSGQPIKLFLVLLVCFWLTPTSWAQSPKRVALVIGNSNYESLPLRNPSNDADDIASLLTSFGFRVSKLKDVTKLQFEDAVDDVTDGLSSGDACLIFYAGHGMQIEGQNFLMPVGATLEKVHHVKQRCVTVSYILDALDSSGCSLKMVVIDSCRNNPFRGFHRGRSGLAELKEAPEGTIVAFSTSPKTTALDGAGNNSPFAKHLINVFKSQGDKSHVVDLFLKASRAVRAETQQRPFLRLDASMPEFYLKPKIDSAPSQVMPPKAKLAGPAKTFVSKTTDMKFVLVPSGTFQMGSPPNEGFRDQDLEYQHEVHLSKDFYIGQYEVTRGQFQSFLRTKNRSLDEFDDELPPEARDLACPITNVRFEDAEQFARWLSSQENLTYRLPSEAEWEYACRAGGRNAYCFGSEPSLLQEYAWTATDNHEITQRISASDRTQTRQSVRHLRYAWQRRRILR